MKYHMLSHTGEKTFGCKKCNYTCTITSRLKTQMIIDSGEKPFICTQCDYSCITACDLKRHMLTLSGVGSANILALKLFISRDTSSKTLEHFACKQRSYSSSHPNNLTHCNALARKAMQPLLQTVRSVLDWWWWWWWTRMRRWRAC